MKKITFMLLAAFTTSGIAGDYSVVVVNGVESLSRLDKDATGNLDPWESSTCETEASKGKLECVVISNSCGFAEAKYRLALHDGETQYVTVRFQIGEWCHIGEFIFEEPQALVLRKWKDSFYLVDSVEVVSDESGSLFIPAGAFTKEEKMEKYFQSFVSSPYSCWNLDFLSKDRIDDLKSNPYITWSDTKVCPNKGVPLGDFERMYSNKQRQPTR